MATKVIELPYLTKPLFGERCNGCGLCCSLSLCELAEKLMPGAKAPCPALEWEDGRSWCGMVRHPTRHLDLKFQGPEPDKCLADLVLKVMPFGQGCGMEDV